MSRKKTKRILLKITGESLGNNGLDIEKIKSLSCKIAKLSKSFQIAVVIGGGNILRGSNLSHAGCIRTFAAHQMGMIATIINGIALEEAICSEGASARLLSALNVGAVAKQYDPRIADEYLDEGRIVILAAGTGNPFVTTDTAAAIRSAELRVDFLAKATKVDGVYTQDPEKVRDAEFLSTLSYDEYIDRRLTVIDITAVRICQEARVPILVFNYRNLDKLRDIISGKTKRTIIR